MSHFKYLPLPAFDEFAQENEVNEQESGPAGRDIRIEFVQDPPHIWANVASSESEAPATVVYITHPDPGLREVVTHLVSTFMYIQPPPYHNAEMDELMHSATERGGSVVDEESRGEMGRSRAALTRVDWPLWCYMLVVVCICLAPAIIDRL
ncbi:hypothetical protein EYR40_002465 [Pleurotus pulmonarius]|nr:hypothetical protein EYR40_002465 [Pleurotus pulmonarius]